jgi:DNA-binding CsgD family transcriptional regulator
VATRAELPGLVLLEREAELETFRSLADAACRGEGGVVAIEGTAGIGKTRLLAEARSSCSYGLRVLTARAGEHEGDFSFGVVRQLFESLLAPLPGEQRAELFAGAAALAEPLFDATHLVTRAELEGNAQFAMMHGLYWLTANLAFERPTMLAIDDVHWADTPSLRWICYLARRLEGLPLLVAVTTRPPEQGRDPALLTELLDDSATTPIRPGPLGSGSIRALVRRRFDEDGEEAFATAVEAATRGNPLLVLALLDTVAREGVRPQADQADMLLELGPAVVGRAVSLRLSRLPAEATALIEAAAILGDGTSIGQVAALAGLEPAPAAKAARVLLHSDLLIRDDPVEFFHPVVRTAIYDGLDTLARSEGHRRAAAVLVDSGALPEQAGAHLLATVAGRDPFVVATLRDAARRSLGQGAAEAAVGYLERALEEVGDDETRAEVLVELGLAERLIEGSHSAEHLAAGLKLMTDPRRRAEVALELGSVLFYINRVADTMAVLERELARVSAADHPDLHERLEAEFIAATWWVPETFPLAAGRLAALDLDNLHGGIGSDLLLADAAFYECRLATDRERAISLARRSLVSGELAGSGALGFQFAAFSLVSTGLFDEAIAAYDAAHSSAEKRGDLLRAAPIQMFRARAKLLRGDVDTALAELRDALERITALRIDAAFPYAVSFLAEALLERGEPAEAEATLAAAGLLDELPVSVHLFFFQYARGRTRVENGALQRGVDDLTVLGERTRVVVPFDNPLDYPWRRFVAAGLRQLGRREDAEAIAGENLELARRWGAPSALGAALRTSGAMIGGAVGRALLREAVDVLRGANARLEHARALVELGAALRRANQRSEARDLLREGVELAHRSGAPALVARGNEELAATGARPRKLVVSGVDSLTASERRVAELAAKEHSNKEIAQTLFVTVKTVEVHLSSVYRKLQITSRRQLVPALARAEDVPV